MSFYITKNIWALPADAIKPLERLVLLALAEFANASGECWPSVKSIADRCGLSERGTRKILRSLEARELLRSNGSKGGRGLSARYAVLPKLGAEQSKLRPGSVAPEQGTAIQVVRPNVSTDFDAGLKTLAHEAKTEHAPLSAGIENTFDAAMEAAGVDLNKCSNPARWFAGGKQHRVVKSWVDDLSLTQTEIVETIQEVMHVRRDTAPIGSLRYFTAAMQRRAAEKQQPQLESARVGYAASRPSPAQQRAQERFERDARIVADLESEVARASGTFGQLAIERGADRRGGRRSGG